MFSSKSSNDYTAQLKYMFYLQTKPNMDDSVNWVISLLKEYTSRRFVRWPPATAWQFKHSLVSSCFGIANFSPNEQTLLLIEFEMYQLSISVLLTWVVWFPNCFQSGTNMHSLRWVNACQEETYCNILFHFISFHFNSLFGHLVPYKHQRQVLNILEIIHVATLVRAHTHAHTHTQTRTHTHTWLFPP